METTKRRYGTTMLSVYTTEVQNFPFETKEEAMETNPPFIVELATTQLKTKEKVTKEFYPVNCDVEIMSRERADSYTKRGKDVANNKLIKDLRSESTWIRLIFGMNYRYYIPFSTVGGKINLRYYKGLKR